MFDEETSNDSSTSNTADSTTKRISTDEYREFRAFKDAKLMEQGIAQGRAMASAEHAAAERVADEEAIRVLASKGVTLHEAFGNRATTHGRNVITNLHRSSFAGKTGVYGRLRRLAQQESLVK